jgi:hypothetical protein
MQYEDDGGGCAGQLGRIDKDIVFTFLFGSRGHSRKNSVLVQSLLYIRPLAQNSSGQKSSAQIAGITARSARADAY